MSCTEAAPDHNKGTGTATIEAAQDDPIQLAGDTVTGHFIIHHTEHTANPAHSTAQQATALRITVDHIHNIPTNC